jgi:hypothetical protein
MYFKFNGHIIQAITIKQPFASLIANGVVDIENRTWNKKIHKNICKNWLFVHTLLQNDNTTSIIGMMHINCIRKISDSIHKTKWASGPNCWYIDAVIKFNHSIPTKGQLGQWNPDTRLHLELNKQINNSMYNIIPLDNIDFVEKNNIFYATQRGQYMTWEKVINSLTQKTDTFIYKLIQFLLNIPHEAYFWECDKVDMKKPFRFAIFDTKTLAERIQDNNAFKGAINCNKYVISFPSLTRDINLVVPCKKSTYSNYTSLATFSRTAPIKQQIALWKKVGQKIKNGDWVSTSGLGVSWLHIRIAKRPKYYHDVFNKNNKKSGRDKIDNFINNYKFPKKFVNIIVSGTNWKSEDQKDLITYYLELLPKNTKVIVVTSDMEEKVNEMKLNIEKYSTDCIFGKQERNKKILENHIDLVTVFGNKEEDLIKQSNKNKIKLLEIK